MISKQNRVVTRTFRPLDEMFFFYERKGEDMKQKLTQQEQVRRQKMQDLIDMGIDPFGRRFDRDARCGQITEEYDRYTKEELEKLDVHVTIAGRIMRKRRQGKAGFMNIQDVTGDIQIYVRKDELGDEMYEIFKKNDIGDIVGIEGTVMKTDHGQLSVRAKEYTHLAKSLRPLPEKFHGLQDTEERYRRRYVDLIMNPEAKKIALTRPRIIRAIQEYLDGQGLMEVETPVLQPILGGAAARPFVTHHNALNMDFYLREELSPDNVNSAIQKILEQVPFVPAQNISFEKLKSFLIEVTEKDSTISSNFVLKMKIYRMIYDVALIRNDTETAIYIYDLISNEIMQWDKEIFEYWFGDKESYLKRLQEYDKNRNCLLDNLKCNLDESKILKLHKYVFL